MKDRMPEVPDEVKTPLGAVARVAEGKCPCCGATETEVAQAPDYTQDSGIAEVYVVGVCLECGAEWGETYSLVGVEVLTEPHPSRTEAL
jgi:hypothetical protein